MANGFDLFNESGIEVEGNGKGDGESEDEGEGGCAGEV